MTRAKDKVTVDLDVDLEDLIDDLDTPAYLELLDNIVGGIMWDHDIIEEFVKILQKRGVPVKDYVYDEDSEEWDWK